MPDPPTPTPTPKWRRLTGARSALIVTQHAARAAAGIVADQPQGGRKGERGDGSSVRGAGVE